MSKPILVPVQLTRRGFTIIEAAISIVTTAVLIVLVVPVIGGVRGISNIDVSLNNLSSIGVAHTLYAGDWNDRQYTNVVDEMSIYGNSGPQAFFNYENSTGNPAPPVLLGWSTGPDGDDNLGIWGYFMSNSQNWVIAVPLDFTGSLGDFGGFRVPNAKPFNAYVDGRVYSPTWYAPGDTAAFETVSPLFNIPDEFVPVGSGNLLWSSYCRSPAALFDPQVMTAPSAGGFVNPWDIQTGHTSPSLSATLYPHLKTQMMEHSWVQGPPGECNPFFGDLGTYDGCEPWYFNLGIDSEPATLFYDGSVRLLPNTEVQTGDQQVLLATGGVDGLWSRDTLLGPDGYFLDIAVDTVVDVSHHVLTTGGIQGRDTLGPMTIRAPRAPWPKYEEAFVPRDAGRPFSGGVVEGLFP